MNCAMRSFASLARRASAKNRTAARALLAADRARARADGVADSAASASALISSAPVAESATSATGAAVASPIEMDSSRMGSLGGGASGGSMATQSKTFSSRGLTPGPVRSAAVRRPPRT